MREDVETRKRKGQRLDLAMTERNLSPKEIAQKMGRFSWNPQTVYNVTGGRRSIEESELHELARILDKPARWFGEDEKFSTLVVREQASVYDPYGEQVDIPLHVPTKSGKVIHMASARSTTRVPAGLAKGNAFAIRIGDVDMAPRFLPGNEVVFRPQDIYDDRCYVAAEHPTEQVEGPDGRTHPRIYIRWYVYEDGRFLLKPRNPDAEAFDAKDFHLLGVAIALKVEHAEDWVTLEARPKALPFDKP